MNLNWGPIMSDTDDTSGESRVGGQQASQSGSSLDDRRGMRLQILGTSEENEAKDEDGDEDEDEDEEDKSESEWDTQTESESETEEETESD